MVQILHPGIVPQKKIVDFTCGHCHCVFRTDEFRRMRNVDNISTDPVTGISRIKISRYQSVCPCCNFLCSVKPEADYLYY